MTLNSLSPQPYECNLAEDTLQFTTHAGILYELYFLDGTGYLEDVEFAPFAKVFGFKPVHPNTSPVQLQKDLSDTRIEATIVAILIRYFSDRRNILMYVCDQQDNKQAARNKLFDKWFNKHRYTFHHQFGVSLVKSDINDKANLFTSLIYREDNFYKQDLEATLPELERKWL